MESKQKYFKDNPKQNTSIEEVVVEGEEILYRGKPKRKAYLFSSIFKMLPIALLWLAFDITFIVIMCVVDEFPKHLLWLIIIFLIFHLTPVWIWLAGIIKAAIELKNIEYAVTDKRIIIKSGVVGIDFKYIYHTEIDSLNVKVGLFDRLFKVGDIYINSRSNAAVLYDLSDPYYISSNIQQISYDIKTDVQFPNAMRPKENDGYKTEYTKKPFKDAEK